MSGVYVCVFSFCVSVSLYVYECKASPVSNRRNGVCVAVCVAMCVCAWARLRAHARTRARKRGRGREKVVIYMYQGV